MNQTTLSDLTQKALQQENSNYTVLLAIITVVVVVLLGSLVIYQRKQINELQKPKYGFLGKPLMIFALVALSIGGIGFTFYSTSRSTNIEQTSADRKIDIDIKEKYSGNGYDYYLNIIPTVDGRAWGGNKNYKFDAYWTIKNGSVVTEAEIGLTSENPGGILKQLQRGTNKIKVTVFFEGKSYVQEASLNL